MMELGKIATSTELIYKLPQADVPLDGAPLMKTAKTTVSSLEINCDARMENPSTIMKILLMSSLYN
jgi:hypothetical protein